MLISEIETLCRDAGIVPGQEPLDSQIDSAFDASIHTRLVEDLDDKGHMNREPLDDRAVRDAFLRFFCSLLGSYERFLVVPDVDFMVSGNEWFDSKGFLSAASPDRAPYLESLVTTQLFQSFIQRRTEASDIQCLLFDECLVEYHSSPIPYGRLGGDVETIASSDEGQPQMLYSLLVDQCSAEGYQQPWEQGETDNRLDDAVSDTGSHTSKDRAELVPTDTPDIFLNQNGEIVTVPSRADLPTGGRFSYCINGQPCFPHKLSGSLFLPKEPHSLLVEISETQLPLLARSEREMEETHRRRKLATSHRGLSSQRRCLWQLPKLMVRFVCTLA
jgi:hypothetical protein